MMQKIEITKNILEIISPDYDQALLKSSFNAWWVNPRRKKKGGLRLSKDGFNAFNTANIKQYKIKLAAPITFTNKHIIWFDNFIDCPWFFNSTDIYVYSEKMAIQLILFDGNLEHFVSVKAKNYQ